MAGETYPGEPDFVYFDIDFAPPNPEKPIFGLTPMSCATWLNLKLRQRWKHSNTKTQLFV